MARVAAQGSHDRPGLVSRVQETVGGMPGWSIEYEGESFARFYRSLPEYEQAVLTAALYHVLRVDGIDICAGEWGKPLGQGLYELSNDQNLWMVLGLVT
jgi:hypothetical protein